METTRREFIQSSGLAAVGATLASSLAGADSARAQSDSSSFDIDKEFAAFMRDIGGGAEDAGGHVLFTGRDPILRSHFRIGSSMALSAAAAGVGAAAIWKERTGQGQDVRIDLREAVYNVNPLITPVMQHRIAAGSVPADDPVPRSFTFTPTINDRLDQAPLGLGSPFSLMPFKTKDGRFIHVTGAYPHLSDRALRLFNIPPSPDKVVWAISQWGAQALEDAMAEQEAVGGIHRTTEEWLHHPQGQYLAQAAANRDRQDRRLRARALHPQSEFSRSPGSGASPLRTSLQHLRLADARGIWSRGAPCHSRPVLRARGRVDGRQRRDALDTVGPEAGRPRGDA